MLKMFLEELLTVHMSPILGSDISSSSVSRVRIFTHSGGYYTAGAFSSSAAGMPQQVRELVLLDSLYAGFSLFDAFVQSNLPEFGPGYSQTRFSSVYTAEGGTYSNNQDMAARAEGWLAAPGSCRGRGVDCMMFDNSQQSLTQQNITDFSLIFKFTTLEHNDVPRFMFFDFLVGAV